MKNKTMKLLSSSLIAVSMMSLPTLSMAEEAESSVSITGNAGFMSEYIFRGVYQEESVVTAWSTTCTLDTSMKWKTFM
jgi:protein-arginine kinase